MRVMRENQTTFTRSQATRAYLTFVAVDEHGRPRPVPALHLETAGGAPPLRRRAAPPGRAAARAPRYEEGLMAITTDVGAPGPGRSAGAGGRAGPRAHRGDRRRPDPLPARPRHRRRGGAGARTGLPRGAAHAQGAGGERHANLRARRTTSASSSTPARPRRVAAALARYAIMDDFAAAPAEDFSLLSLLGPAAAARLAGAGVEVGALAGGRRRWRTPRSGRSGWCARASSAPTASGWAGRPPRSPRCASKLAAAVPELDAAVAEAARIDALEPRFGAEITADYFPMEVGLAGAIDYAKGCYLGQEPIVRVRDRGHINWRLVGLDVADGGDPHPGDALTSETKPKAGKITSAARFPDGRAVALAMAHVSLPVGRHGARRPRRGPHPRRGLKRATAERSDPDFGVSRVARAGGRVQLAQRQAHPARRRKPLRAHCPSSAAPATPAGGAARRCRCRRSPRRRGCSRRCRPAGRCVSAASTSTSSSTSTSNLRVRAPLDGGRAVAPVELDPRQRDGQHRPPPVRI